jgi:hypothetical protein
MAAQHHRRRNNRFVAGVSIRFWALQALAITAAMPACSSHPSMRCRVINNQAYIDTVGFRAFSHRQRVLGDELFSNPDSAVRMALRPMSDTADNARAAPDSTVFAEIEQSYQRYLRLFSARKTAAGYEACFPYNLIQTLQTGKIDRQPFMNAILHSLGLTDLTTLDYSIQRLSDRQLQVIVMWSAPAKTLDSELHIAEGQQTIYVSPHRVTLHMKN